MLEEIIKFIGGGAVLLGAVAWLIRSLISHFLTKDIEEYKLSLKREADKELETIKSSLSIKALSHQIRYSKLHVRRADVIEKLYRKIVDLQVAAECLKTEFSFEDNEELIERANTLIDKYFEVHSFIEENKIYFSEDLSNNIKSFNKLYFDLSIGICYLSKKNNWKQVIENFQDEKENFESQNNQIKCVIETEFRKLLGVLG